MLRTSLCLVALLTTGSVGTELPPKRQGVPLERLLPTEFVGNLQVTSYRSVRSQTDSSPFYTSIGIHTNPYLVAVSQDLLKQHKVKYGDLLFIDGIGFKHVGDCMNARLANSIDIWVSSYSEEVAFQKKWKSGKVKVWKVKRNFNEQRI